MLAKLVRQVKAKNGERCERNWNSGRALGTVHATRSKGPKTS